MDYKGIKIYNKILIVEKTEITEDGYNWRGRTVNQGYIVDKQNKKMLDNALRWAKWTKYDASILGGKYYWHKEVTDDMRAAYQASKKTMEGIVHEYDNGSFTISLSEAALTSSQGGKVSFWNCIITAPDGKSFLVGINSELLLHLLVSNTFINGTCQGKVWLGRVGTQTGAFTEAMEDFKQAKLDEEKRNAVKKASTKYVPGDIVATLKQKQLYVGSVYKYYSVTQSCGHYYVIIYDKPKLVHIFRDFYKPWNSDVEELQDYYIEKSNKPKKIIDSHIDLDVTAAEYLYKYHSDKIATLEQTSTKEDSKYYSTEYYWDCVQKLKAFSDKADTYSKEEIKKFLTDKFNEIFHCKESTFRKYKREYSLLIK